MAIRSGFFNSVNGDRKYDAAWFAQFFASFIGNGVFPNPSNQLQVGENTNMTTTVKPGKGWINGYFIVIDSDYVLQHDNADGVLKRIDRIVMRLDFLTREIEVVVKKGVFASTPVAPALQRDTDAHELALADVLIANGATQITQVNITDQRLNSEVCGIVHGVVDQVDTTTIFNQYLSWFEQFKTTEQTQMDLWQAQEQADFETWFASIQDVLDGNVALNLQNQINLLTDRVNVVEQNNIDHQTKMATLTEAGHVKHGTLTATISTSWVGASAPYTQAVTIAGILATDNPTIAPVYSGDNSTAILEKTAWNMISKGITTTDTITFTCFEEKPLNAINISIKVVR